MTAGLVGGPGPTFGAAEGVLDLTTAGDDPGTALRAAFPDPAEALRELGDLFPDIPNLTLVLIVLGLVAVAVIVFKVA